jgi:hypothetical protein
MLAIVDPSRNMTKIWSHVTFATISLPHGNGRKPSQLPSLVTRYSHSFKNKPFQMSHIFASGTIGRRQKKAGPPVQDTYTLICYIAGDKATLVIIVPRTAYVGQLRQRIHEEAVANRFKCHIMNMAVWKVCQDWRAVWCSG